MTEQENAGEWAFDGHGELHDLSNHILDIPPAPEPITWRNVVDVPKPHGYRCAIPGDQGQKTLYDHRVVSPVYEDLDGGQWVNVCHEPVWWDWIDMGDQRSDRVPHSTAVRACYVWVEVRYRAGDRIQ